MSEILEKIRSRGYWKVIIRPAAFVEKRVAYLSALLPIMERTSVDFKGWSFPHVESRNLDEGPDWIGQELSWDSINELWRFYQSGQFVYYSSMLSDWSKHSDTYTGWPSQWVSADGCHQVLLDIKEVIVRFSEIFEFAARLAFTEAGDNQVHLEVAVKGAKEHLLRTVPGNRASFFYSMDPAESEQPYIADLPTLGLVANAREMALKPAVELFQRFKWDPGIVSLRDIQDELLATGQPRSGKPATLHTG